MYTNFPEKGNDANAKKKVIKMDFSFRILGTD